MNLKNILEQQISDTLSIVSGIDNARALVNNSKSAKFGDYQANGVMALAKRLKQNPRELGQSVIEALAQREDINKIAVKLELAGPGFINIFISPEFLSERLNQISHGDLIEKTLSPKTVVIDYSAPNLAKEMHVGHLRGTNFGDSIARTFEYIGHTLIKQNHFGDWGTQFGMLITYMLELKTQESNVSTQLSDLETFYRAAKQRFDSDETFAQTARNNVVKLQSGDEDFLKIWRSFIEVSIEHCQALYKKLNITLTEQDIVPESFFNNKLAGIINDLENKNLLEESNGAKCVFLEQFKNKEGNPLPVIVQKSDGGYLYATTDLAAARYRSQELNAERILYVVDARQSLHFQQVFAVAKKAEFVNERCSLEHLSYGTIMGEDGKPFKTRSGDTIKLVELLDEGIARAYQLVNEKNPDLDETEKRSIAEEIGISSIKYSDLSKNRNSDYIFNWETILSFEGNTAPYMLYAYARIRSIFRRQEIDSTTEFPISINATEEKELALKIAQFPEVIDGIIKDCLPNQLCLYLYELAGIYMMFYEACPVLKAQENIRNSRLGLCNVTSKTLKQGLHLLGINTLEKM